MKAAVAFGAKPDHIKRLGIVSVMAVDVFGSLAKQTRLPF
jgi:hypothetical protein